ncbi:metallophosphoesterase [Bacillus tianshenii]|nr:metallophosphoesterase [Bacillus tianshenii]
MKVLIVSDNHGDADILKVIHERHEEEVDAFIHCGDSELAQDCAEMAPFTGVRGNCDYDDSYPNDVTVPIADVNCYVTHGHLYNVKMSLMNLQYRAEEVGAKIVCYGHSHIAGAEYTNGVLFINPGSIRLPRLRREKTYAILDVKHNEAVVSFYTDAGEEVKELSVTTTL